MRSEIPQGLHITYLFSFIFSLVFGLAGTLAPKWVGDLARHPVHDVDVNILMGVAALTFAIGSWNGYRATRWEPIRVVTLMGCFFNGVGGAGGLVAYFLPGPLGLDPLPPVQLLVSIILLAIGLGFIYYYAKIQFARTPLMAKQA